MSAAPPTISLALAERLKHQAQAKILERQRAGTWSGGVVAHTAWQKDPLGWIVKHLDVPEHTLRWSLNPGYEDGKHVWDGDKDPLILALDELARGNSIAISSGTNTQKTYSLGACGTLWFLACFERSIVLSIAPRADQLLLNLWKNLGELFPRFKRHFPSATMLTGKLRMLEGVGEQEVWAATASGAGVGAQEEVAQRLAGFHQAHMLWIVEETPGVDGALMNTIINTATGQHNPILAMGNPDHRYDTLGLFAARPWVKAIRISALDHPNVVTGREVVPGAVTAESIRRRLADAGGNVNDPIYLSRVRGIAPSHSKRALIQLAWCEAAALRWADPAFRAGPLALGVDPADSATGDMSAIARGQGACCTEVEAFHAADASELGRILKREIRSESAPIDPRFVGIDSVGVGASTVNELKRLGIRVRLISGGKRAVPRVDVGRRPDAREGEEDQLVSVVEAEVYDCTRSQVLWALREDLRLARIALPDDPKLFEELTALEYKDEESGFKITVLPKAGVRARIGRSPDRSDAVAYWNWVRPRPRVRPKKQPTDEERPARNRDQGLERFMAAHAKRQKAEEARFKRVFARRARGGREA